MKIILLRHGKPNISNDDILGGKEFANWVDEYNSASLDLSLRPSNELLLLAKSAQTTICSSLLRSIESAKALGIDNYESDNNFREAELPYFDVFSLKFRSSVWLVIFRISWLLGFSGETESFSGIKLRAIKCSKKLSEIATRDGSVLFVGHGILNRIIAKQLVKSGWYGPTNPQSGYWNFSVYENKK